ncbi:MAG: hypothetical protein GF311_04820 [Candidatus Lokiarchaeota archaeon]|nr:hypothetical protein [Candidatus Lokiarchaeota archaeon]
MINRKNKIIFFITLSSLLFLAATVNAQATQFSCPSTQAGDTKILEVKVVNEAGLEGIFGSNWKTVLNTSFGGSAATLGAQFKSVIVEQDTNDYLNYTNYGLGLFPVCNITVDVWAFQTGPFLEANKSTLQVYIIKDPANLTAYVQTIRAIFMSPGNVTVPWAADVSYSAYLGQLAVPPIGYLDGLVFEDGWTTPGSSIVHEVTAGYTPPFTTFTYLQNCTETWTYFSNGALIGYTLQNNESQTVYSYNIVLPGGEIPGYELSIFIGISAISMLGIVYYMKKKKFSV